MAAYDTITNACDALSALSDLLQASIAFDTSYLDNHENGIFELIQPHISRLKEAREEYHERVVNLEKEKSEMEKRLRNI